VTDGTLRFLPWLRRGLAAAVPGTAPPGATPGQRSAIPVTLNVRHDATAEQVPLVVRLYGPGDVLQLDQAQVIATEPKPLTSDFPPSHLAAICFDAPELPWLFTPGPTPPPGDQAGRLLPWLCLVVIRRDAAQLAVDAGRPVPTLRIADAGGELPDLAESWAWAHAQLAGTGTVSEVLTGPPERTLSRLICPRRLRPATAYVACVVPAFAAGRQAGLGQQVTATIEPAWTWPAHGPAELPVYFSWEFATGPAGDFEALVRRIKPRALDAQVGLRPMDISRAGSGLPVFEPGAPGAMIGLEGALRSPAMVPSDWPDVPREEFQRRLAAQLQARPGGGELVLTPPLYGGAQAAVASLARDGPAPAWLRELNLDPRHRAAAAFGVRLIQQHQEHLVAAAWDQIGELDRVNQLLREGQLARAAAGSLREKRLAQLPPAKLLHVTGPVHARIAAPPGAPGQPRASLLGAIRVSAFPETAAAPPFRRVLRPRGPLGRRIGGDGPVSALTHRLAQGSVEVPIVDQLSGSVAHDSVGTQRLSGITARVPRAAGWRVVADFLEAPRHAPSLAATPLAGRAIAQAPASLVGPATRAPLGSQATVPPPESMAVMTLRRIDDDLPPDAGETEPSRRRRLGGINGRFRAAARAMQAYLAQPVGLTGPRPPAPPLPVGQIATHLAGLNGRLDPELTVPATVTRLIGNVPDGAPGPDVLTPACVAPSFQQPMSEPLRVLSADLLLPASDRIPPDSIGLLVGNPRFIEAFMVGLNHEMGREFLWRGLPADPRATYFRQFWDVRGRQRSAPGPVTDIPPIAAWSPASGLGANATRVGGRDMLVLLIRGDLVRRYPTLTLYAVRAAAPGTMGAEELYPEFRCLLDPDMLVAGFGIGLSEARGGASGPGWFFVLQEQVTEPRFGLDEAGGGCGGVPASWDDLAWEHLVADEQSLAGLSHVPVESPALNPRLRNLALQGATWGRSAADMAQIALRQPVRVAVHARTLLPEVAAADGDLPRSLLSLPELPP
jgi:hypothetical protein